MWARLISRGLIAICLALAVNILLIGGYLWSAGGATTHVRIEAAGINGRYTVFVDGKQQDQLRCGEYAGGAVLIKLPTDNEASSLPHPQGLERLVITGTRSGAVLFDSNSSNMLDTTWMATGDRWRTISIGDNSWQYYAVDAYFKNPTQAVIMVHSADPYNGIVYAFRPYRHLDAGLDYMANGKTQPCPTAGALAGDSGVPAIGEAGFSSLELSKPETLKSMLAMTLRPYPYILGALCAMLAVTVVLHLAGMEKRLRQLRLPRTLPSPGSFVLLIAAAAFGLLVFISHNLNSGMPHVPDELAYLFQAKIFASFRLTVPIPHPKEAFDFFYPSMLVDSGGRWAGIVLFGHPLALATGELVGAVWLVPPVLGALSILLIYRVGRQIHGIQVGVLAAVLLAFSPFFQMTASNLMSHNTAVFYLLACLLLITANWKRKSVAYGLAGLCFGLFLNTRPLTAVALVPPFGLLFLSDLALGREQRPAIIRRTAAFAAGVLVMVGAFYLYSLATTGSLRTGYGANLPIETMVGFGEKNSVARGMENDQAQLSSLLFVLNGWPLFVGLALVLLPFMLGSRSRWDLFLLLGAVCSMGVWTAFESNGLMYGPRYWYEAVPFLMLLTARGLALLQDWVTHWAGLIGRQASLIDAPMATGRMLSYGLLLVLLGISVHGWMLGKHSDMPKSDYVPLSISELQGFNGADDRLLRKVDAMGLHNALVLVKPCIHWQCYGTVFWKNDADFAGDIVYAQDLPRLRNYGALAAYLDRQMYLADYDTGIIVPYDPFPVRLDSPGA